MRSSRLTLSSLLAMAAISGLSFAPQQPRDGGQTARAADSGAVRTVDTGDTAHQLRRASVDKFVRMAAGSFGRGLPRPTGRGWPVATDRRRARKARNQARHRRACK